MDKRPTEPEIHCPTEAEIRRLCASWQELLRLQHWTIKIRYAGFRDMTTEDGIVAWGKVTTFPQHQRAKMAILRPEDYEDNEGREEIEKTVVHELLHVLFCGLRDAIKAPDPAGDLREEQVINLTAELLVNLRHEIGEN